MILQSFNGPFLNLVKELLSEAFIDLMSNDSLSPVIWEELLDRIVLVSSDQIENVRMRPFPFTLLECVQEQLD